jgi:hypothetical protein
MSFKIAALCLRTQRSDQRRLTVVINVVCSIVPADEMSRLTQLWPTTYGRICIASNVVTLEG